MRIDECPVCDKEVDVYSFFSGGAGDYETQFEYECEHCGALLDIEVTAEPIFGITEKKPHE